MPVVNQLATECIESVFDILLRGETSKPLAQDFLTVANPATLEPWRSLLVRNTPGTLPPSDPGISCAGFDRWPRPSAGDAELHAAAVPGPEAV